MLDVLKEDIKKVEKKLQKKEYLLILGIAKGKEYSVFETIGVNKFNKWKILADGEESYSLYFPEQGFENIKVNKGYTASFCNWGMYMVSKFINESRLDSKHTFVHIKKEDISLLKRYLAAE